MIISLKIKIQFACPAVKCQCDHMQLVISQVRSTVITGIVTIFKIKSDFIALHCDLEA
jgi:hypothetical protein